MKTIFKIGDRVFDYQYGWGEIEDFDDHGHLTAKFEIGSIIYMQDGRRPSSSKPTLSFTEYTLQGFSQERPIEYEDYIGKWGAFWYDNDNDCLIISKLVDFGDELFETEKGGRFINFKPLSEEQIKVLEL